MTCKIVRFQKLMQHNIIRSTNNHIDGCLCNAQESLTKNDFFYLLDFSCKDEI